MSGALHRFLTDDHARLDALLTACLEQIDDDAYQEFRRGLLRHIGMEERVLFPLLRKRRGATELEAQLHRDHAALAALLVPPPTAKELREIAAILEVHNGLEESPGGLYEVIEGLAGEELEALMEQVHAIPQIPLAPHTDSPLLRSTIEQLLAQASGKRT